MTDAVTTGPPSLSPGAWLRSERERQGMSPGKAAEQLRLDITLIEAIEADRYAALGAPVYARGHLRKYGALLGIPGGDLVAAYDALHSGPAAPTLIPAASVGEFYRPRRWLLPAAALVLAVLVAGSLWWAFGRSTAPAGATTAGSPVAAAPAVSQEGDVAVPAAAGDGSGEAYPADEPAAADAAGRTAVPAATTVSASRSAPALPRATVTAAQPAAGTLQVSLTEDCWLEVYDGSGRRVAFEMAPAGAVRRFGRGPWKLLLGNAGAVQLSLDGRSALVPPAMIARNVAWIAVDPGGAVVQAESSRPASREN